MNIKKLVMESVVAGIAMQIMVGLPEDVEAQSDRRDPCGVFMTCAEPASGFAEPVWDWPLGRPFDPCGVIMSCAEPASGFAEPVWDWPLGRPFDPCGVIMSCAEPASGFAEPVWEDWPGALDHRAELASGFAEPVWDWPLGRPFDPCGVIMSCAEPASGFAEPVWDWPLGRPFDPCGVIMSCAEPASGFAEPASDFVEPASGFAEPASGFAEPASDFVEPASGFAEPASGFAEPASDFVEPVWEDWPLGRPLDPCGVIMSCAEDPPPPVAFLTISEFPKSESLFGHLNVTLDFPTNAFGARDSIEIGFYPSKSGRPWTLDGRIRPDQAPHGARAVTLPVDQDKFFEHLRRMGGTTGKVDRPYFLPFSNCVTFVADFLEATGVESEGGWFTTPGRFMDRLFDRDDLNGQCTVR